MPAVKKTAVDKPDPAEEATDKLVTAIEPVVGPREQRIKGATGSGFDEFDKTYTQKKVNFLRKLDLVKVLATALKGAVADGQDISSAISAFTTEASNSGAMLGAILNLAENSPEIVQNIMMISMDVPVYEREIVQTIMRQDEQEDGSGGLSDKDGIAIIETFIGQNAVLLRDFFVDEIPSLVANVSKRLSGPDQTQAQ